MSNCYRQTTHESPFSVCLRKPQGSPEKGFPSAAWVMVGDTGEVSQPLPAACGRGLNSMQTQMVVSSTAGALAKVHTSSYLWFSHNHICMPFFWTKIYIFIKNWSPNFNDFIHGLESGSKGTDPIMTRRLRDRKSSSSGREKYKVREWSTLTQPHPCQSSHRLRWDTGSPTQRGSRAPHPLGAYVSSLGKPILTASSEVLLHRFWNTSLFGSLCGYLINW